MNIVIVGAGAIGSLFGALLAKKNTVVLLGRTPHVKEIQQHGLQITGKTRLQVKPSAVDSTKDITISPELLILTVKSYDTESAIQQARGIINDNTVVLCLQNGLDNIEKIEHYIDKKHILAGITTHGAIFSKPGCIMHTGTGKTLIGELNGASSDRLKQIVQVFNDAGIITQTTPEIQTELWVKAIINSSINPLTGIFHCENGYLLENPLLEKTIEHICEESTQVAQAEGVPLTTNDMIQRTKEVITDTAKNHSSMLQSIQQGKKTEIASINGKLVSTGKAHGIKTPLNEILTTVITSIKY